MCNISAVDVVNKQLEYYNAGDIEGFVSTYSPDIRIFNLGEEEPFLTGLTELKARYTQRFSNPKLRAHIANRIVVGDRVIDYEEVTGIKENEVSRVVAIYEVKQGLIHRVWFVRE